MGGAFIVPLRISSRRFAMSIPRSLATSCVLILADTRVSFAYLRLFYFKPPQVVAFGVVRIVQASRWPNIRMIRYFLGSQRGMNNEVANAPQNFPSVFVSQSADDFR